MDTRRINSIKELDLPHLRVEDLAWHFGTGQAQSTGSGRDKRYTYRTGVQTLIGDIEISVWMEAAEHLVQREALQEEMEHLEPFLLHFGNSGPNAKRDFRARLLDACLSGLYKDPKWICFEEYNRKHHPELLDQQKEEIIVEMENQGFAMRPASHDEAGLFYSLPPEKDAELGTIGHIRIDFGRSGAEFWHTWWPRGSEELNSPEFKAELDRLVEQLRQEDGPLRDLSSMDSFCFEHGGAIEEGWRKSYGYIAETERYRFCLRCIPRQGDYNAYLTCYDKRVQEMAQKPLVGRLRYASGEVQEFTDPEKYIAAFKEELPLKPTTGMTYETLTDDPKVRKAIDDTLHGLFGEENPRPLADYENGDGPSTTMTMGGM